MLGLTVSIAVFAQYSDDGDTHLKVFSELIHEFEDDVNIYVDVLYSEKEVPCIFGPPYYIPQRLVDVAIGCESTN